VDGNPFMRQQGGGGPRRGASKFADKYGGKDEEEQGEEGHEEGGGQGEEGEEETENELEVKLNEYRALKNPFIRAARLFEAGAMDEAVDGLCSQDMFRITINAKEIKAGKPLKQLISHASALLKVCGVVVLDGVIPAGVVKQLAEKGAAAASARVGSVEVDASGQVHSVGDKVLQFETAFVEPFTNPRVTSNPFVSLLLRRSLGPRIEIDDFSTVVALPQAPLQQWSTDGSALFPRSGTFLPAHSVSVTVALGDMTEKSGALDFIPGSHVACAQEEEPQPVHFEDGSSLDLCSTVPGNRVLSAQASAGTVVLFDSRMYRRSQPNQGTDNVVSLSSSYVRDWYHDADAPPHALSKAIDDMVPQQRKLFTRLNHRQYVRELQEQIKSLGGQVGESQYGFSPETYDKA
jgi:hypothetical protein